MSLMKWTYHSILLMRGLATSSTWVKKASVIRVSMELRPIMNITSRYSPNKETKICLNPHINNSRSPKNFKMTLTRVIRIQRKVRVAIQTVDKKLQTLLILKIWKQFNRRATSILRLLLNLRMFSLNRS